MSNKALNWAFNQPLPPMQKLVLVALADMARDKDYSCFPGHGRLVDLTGASEKTIQRALKGLEDQHLLTRQRRNRSNGSRTSDSYVLAVTLTDRTKEPNGHSDRAQAVTLTDRPYSPKSTSTSAQTLGSEPVLDQKPNGHSDPPITIEPPVLNQERSGKPESRPEPSQEVAVIQGELVPAEEPKRSSKSPEHLATDDAYEKTGKAFNFIATRGIAKWLIHDRGLSPEMASKAIVMVYEMGKPITKQVLGQLIDGHIRPGGGSRPSTSDRINDTLAIGEELQAMIDQQRRAS